MRSFKKIVSLLVSAVLVCGMLTGCGEEEKADKLVLAVRSGTYAEVIKMCIPGFEEKYGITCEVVELSEDDLHSEILHDSLNSKGSYDIIMADSSWVSELLAEGALADLGALGYKLDTDIIPATTDICIKDGKMYLVPYYGNVTVMLYNRTVAESLGFNVEEIDTLDEISSLCNASSAAGYGGFVARGDTANNVVVDFLPVLRAFGGWVVDSSGKPTVNTAEFKAALNYYMNLLKTGRLLPKDQLISSIETGSQVLAVGWPGWYMTDAVNSDYCAFPGMVKSGDESYNSNIYGIWTLGIPANCRYKSSAAQLLNYLMDPEVQKSTIGYGGVPCRYSCLTDPEIVASNPHLEVICSALENGIYRPSTRKWPEFYAILGARMTQILSGELSVDDGLTLAQEELEALMK
ncbi:MAG: extracellular solute-binding protein [Lachnospiraceae bacterium]|nr:extracellular solute-binding protein [Lachnospiraceae bacterium]